MAEGSFGSAEGLEKYILYPAYYDRKNNQNLLYKKDAEFQYI